MAFQLSIEEGQIVCSVSLGDDVTEDMSVTPASNSDMLIRGSLEPDLTLD